MKQCNFLDNNELKPTVSTLNVETILEENVQIEISLTRVIDVNRCILENEISSGPDTTSQGQRPDTSWYPNCR